MNTKQIVLFCVMLAGTAGIMADTTPVISRVYGDYLRNESTAQSQTLPSRGVSGLDTGYSTDGIVIVDSDTLSSAGTLDILKIVRQSDDKLVIAASNAGLIKVFRLDTAGALDGAFGSSGVIATSIATVEDMIYDATNSKILIVSDTGSNTGLVYSYLADGSVSAIDPVSPQVSDSVANTNFSNAKMTMLSDDTMVVFAKTTADKPKLLKFTYPASEVAQLTAGSTYTFDADGSDNTITVKGIVSDGTYLYACYLVGTAAYVAKLNSSGALVTSFSVDGRVAFSASSDIRIALDAYGNLAVATLNTDADTITVRQISRVTGATGISGTLTPDAGDISLGGLLPCVGGNLYVYGTEVGTSSTSALNQVLVKRLSAVDYTADTLFNSTGTLRITPTTSGTAFARTSPTAVVLAGGDIMLGANETIDTVHTIGLVQVNTDAGTTAIEQFTQDFGTAPASVGDGSVDTTFGTLGTFKPFAGIYEGALQQKIRGAALLASDKIMTVMDGKGDANASSHITFARVTAAGAFDTSFNTTGYAEQSYASSSAVINTGVLSTAEYVKNLFVDKNGKYLVAGYATNGGTDHALLRRFTTAGAADSYSDECSVTTNQASVFYDVAVQSNQRVIVCGKNNSDGRIFAFKGANLDIDDTFAGSGGNSVYELTGRIMYSIAINDYDNIFFVAHGPSDEMFLYCLDENGDVLDDTFSSDGIVATGITIAASKPDQMKVALEDSGKVVVACVNSSGDFAVRRYLTTGAVDTSFNTDGSILTLAVSGDAILRDIKVLTDNTILLIGANDAADDSMVIARITSAGVADSAFGTSGVASIQIAEQDQYAREFTTAVVQSTGAIIAVGHESFIAAESCPVVVRVNATGATAEVGQVVSLADGSVDTTLDATGVLDLNSLLGAGTATTIYHNKWYHNGLTDARFLIGYYTGADSYIARFESDNSLDTSFDTDGMVTLTSNAHINHLILDADDKILTCGGDGTNGSAWVKRLTSSGGADITFTMPFACQNAYKVLEQESGRVIVAAEKDDGTLVVIAFKDTGTLDTTFNPLGATPGAFVLTAGDLGETADTGFIDIAIGKTNSTDYGYDRIYVAYKVSNVPKIVCLQDNGIRYSGFGTSGIVSSGATAVAGSNVRVGVDSTQKASLGYVISSSGTKFQVKRYTAAGALVSSGTVTSTDLGSGAQVTGLMPLSSYQVVACGYNTAGSMLFTRTDTGGTALDTEFNTTGEQSFSGNSSSVLHAMTCSRDGRIFAVGATTDPNPTLVRVHSLLYTVEWEQHPRQSAIGTFDKTIGATGLDLTASSYLNDTGYQLKRVYQFDGAAGGLLLAFDKASADTIKLLKLKADRTKDTSFGSGSGIVTITSVSTTGASVTPDTVTDLYVNRDGEIYVCGQTTASKGWVVKLASDGTVDSTFKMPTTVGTSFSTIQKVQQLTDSKILISGIASNGTTVQIKALNSLTGVTDATFTTISVATSTGFADVAVDQYNRIYALYHDGTDLYLKRYLSYGTQDASVTNPLTATSGQGARAQLAIDTANNAVVIGTVTSSAFKLRKYTYSTNTTLTAATAEVSFGSSISALANIRIDSSAKVYVAGYDSSSNIVVARRSSALAADTAYDSGGDGIVVLSDATTTLNRVTDVVLHPDRRIELFGYLSTNDNAYMARVFGDNYTTQVVEENLYNVQGTIDLAIDKTEVDGYLEIDEATTDGKRVAYSRYANSLVFVVDDGTNSKVRVANMDATTVTTGVSDLPAGVKSLVELYNEGLMLVAGDTGAAVWARKVNPTTGASDTTCTIPGTITGLNGAVCQKSGRIIVYGYDSVDTTGVVVALKNTGAANEVRFGLSTETNVYQTGINATVLAAVVDSSDNIYLVYNDTNTKVRKLKAHGVLDTAFGTGGTYDLGAALSNVQLSLSPNSVGNIDVVIAGTTAANEIKFFGLNASGSTLTNGTSRANDSTDAFSEYSVHNPIVYDLAVASDGYAYVLGSDDAGTSSFVMRIMPDLSDISATFNEEGLTADNNGLWVEFGTADSPKTFYSGYVQDDGRLITLGTSANNKPVLVRFFAFPFSTHTQDTQSKTRAGLVDTTSDISTGLNINTATGDTGHTVGRLIHGYEDGSGKLLVITQGASDSTIMRLNKDYTFDTSFSTDGKLTVSSLKGANKLLVDESGNIFVTGTHSGAAWLFACNSTGGNVSYLTAFATPATLPTVKTMSKANAVARQTLTRTLLAGYNSTDSQGCIMALTNDATSAATSLDVSFGSNAGYYNTGVATEISDMFVDANDRIVFAYRSTTSVIVKRLLPHGVNLDTTFGTNGTLTLTSATTNGSAYDAQIKLHQLSDGSIGLAYKTDPTTITMKKLSTAGAVTATETQIVASSAVITAAQVDSQGRFVVVGYDATSPFIIRVNSSFVADTTFGRYYNTATINGYLAYELYYNGTQVCKTSDDTVVTTVEATLSSATYTVPSGSYAGAYTAHGYVLARGTNMVAAYGASLVADNRYILVGTDDASTPTVAYIIRIYGDNYNTVPSQNPTRQRAGTIDTRLSLAANVDYLDLVDGTNMISALTGIAVSARSMVLIDNTVFYILLEGPTHSYVAAVSVDGVLDTTFNSAGTPGYVTISNKTGAKSILYTIAGTLLVAGNASNATWLREYSTSGASVRSYTDTSAMSVLSGLAQQATSRVIIGGEDTSNDFMYAAYTPTGSVDTTFGTSGVATQSSYDGISHFIVDTANRLTASFVDTANLNHVTLLRTDIHGRKLDVTFSTDGLLDTEIVAGSASSIARVAQVADSKIVVACANADNNVQIKRYTSAGADDANITVNGSFTAPQVSQIIFTTDGKLLVVGYDNAVDDLMFVIRLTSGLALDTSFAESSEGAADGAGYITMQGLDALSIRQLSDGVALHNGQIVILGQEA